MLDKLKEIDDNIVNFIGNKLSCKLLDNLMKVITFLGDYAIVWIFIVMYLFYKGYVTESIAIISSLSITSLLNECLLKRIFKRARPAHRKKFNETIIKVPNSYSFPSGHTATAFAVVPLAFISCNISIGVISFVTALIIAFSRIYLKVHYLSDVIVGAIVGTCISLSTYMYIFL